MCNEVIIDGVPYVRKEVAPSGTRAVMIVDRGWIFAGDVNEENGRIKLTRAVWVLRWESIGFDGMIADPRSPNVNIKILTNDVDIPAGSELFRIPVADDWGL